MNKKFIISLGLVAAISVATISAMADSTIYTDGIGRIHFLGKDAKSNTGANYNYANSSQQDLTRKLYEQSQSGIVNDTTYDQHPLKNYENTFPDSRFTTSKYWKTKYANSTDEAIVNTGNTAKGFATAEKGASEVSNQYVNDVSVIKESEKNIIKSSNKKKHWWNKD